MNDMTKLFLTSTIAGTLMLGGCGNESPNADDTAHADHDEHDHGEGDHDHGGEMHDDHDDHDHADDVALDPITLEGMTIELAQGHGEIEPGKEMHLVVKLPYSDNGATVIRSWLGTEDRFASVVAKAEYAASHDDYDVHAIAPDPLPENTMWYIEIEKPDGQKLVGNTTPR